MFLSLACILYTWIFFHQIQCVSTEFVDSEKRIALRRPFKTKHGIVLSPTATYDGEDKRDSRLFEGDSPMLVLMEFMRLQNLRLVDLFSTLDKNSDHQITHEEIRTKLQVNLGDIRGGKSLF